MTSAPAHTFAWLPSCPHLQVLPDFSMSPKETTGLPAFLTSEFQCKLALQSHSQFANERLGLGEVESHETATQLVRQLFLPLSHVAQITSFSSSMLF